MSMSLLIIGCGNMGGAMLAGWLAAGHDPMWPSIGRLMKSRASTTLSY